ncbi:MAG: ADOP family duplicated permease [Acidobacteriota bacterium]
MFGDIRHAFRVFRQSPGWTAVVLVSLAVGLGANTAFFSAVNEALLRSVAVESPEDLVRFTWSGENDLGRSQSEYGFLADTVAGERRGATFSLPLFEALKESAETLDGLFACAPFRQQNVTYAGNSEVASVFVASGDYFDVLGVEAHRGRLIGPEDDDPAAPPAVMLSYGYWQSRFGGEEVLGESLQVGRIAATIVGVLPADYSGIQNPGASAEDLHLPLSLSQAMGGSELLDATYFWVQIMGRLAPGATAEQVAGNLQGPFAATSSDAIVSYVEGLTEEQAARSYNQDLGAVPRLLVDSGARGVYDPSPNVARDASILAVIVCLVLLIVCANVANLLLSRSSSRRHELSVRQSFGASRGRLVRQLLVESTILSLFGGALGLLLALWARQLLPFASGAEFDASVFGFAFGLSLLTGVFFSIVPSLRSTGGDLASSLQEGGRTVKGSKRVLGRMLLVAQVAIAVVLVVGALLFLTTLRNLRAVDVGFDPSNLMLVRVDPGLVYEDEDQIERTHAAMVERVAAVAGVERVSLARSAFLSGSTSTRTMHRPEMEGTEGTPVHIMTVAPEFFATLRIPLLAGRDFLATDTDETPDVAVVNATAAREFFSDRALGERFGWRAEERTGIEVIGVVGDVKYAAMRDAAPPTIFVPYAQGRIGRSMILQMRTATDPTALIEPVRAALREVDPAVPILNVSTQSEEIAQQLSQERFFAMAYAAFGAAALLLAAIGLFGVASYGVAERRQEIGVRCALGATRSDVMRLVVGESMTLVAVGLGLGVVGSLSAARLLGALLFEVSVGAPAPLLAAALLLVAVCGLAAYLPARRAASIDPVTALQQS